MKKISFKLSFILLTLVILSAHSCGRRDRDHDKNGGGCHNPKPEVNNLVIGTWKLQNISCNAGTTETATKSVVLIIEANNNYSFVTDGVKTSQGTYSFSQKNSKIDGISKQFLDFSNDASFILDVNSSRLGLGQDVVNGKNYSYVK